MPRPSVDRTRALLIDAAAQLFATKGYDLTGVEAIIQQAGVSKGAFYHHFASKEELLDAVADRMGREAMEASRPAVADRSVGAIARLNRFFEASRGWAVAHFGLLRQVLVVLYRDQNAPMRRKIEASTAAWGLPLLADILRQGVEEGVFDVSDPEETARLLLQLSWALRETQVRTMLSTGLTPEALVVLERRLHLYLEMVERMLGAPKGAIERIGFGVTADALDAAPVAQSAAESAS